MGLIGKVVRAAAAQFKEISVCGELASDLRLTARLLGVGIKTVSVDAAQVAAVRRQAKAVSVKSSQRAGCV